MLHDEIASGGMATVHIACAVGTAGFSRTVAIKRLHAHYARDPEFAAMLLDEATLAARIHHPNVVPTLDVVVGREGELFLVMEYVAGESLARLLGTARRRAERAPLPIVLSVITQALYGLHAAHEAKSQQGEPLAIVHRDISPQNILVGLDGVARVLDFGVAKAATRLQTTRDGQVKGKLLYMAPEQVRMDPIDRRTDVYAASCVLWEALTGQRVVAAAEPAAIVHQILTGVVQSPSSLVPDLPASLDAVVQRGLSKDPRDRFPTALAMADELERLGPLATSRVVGAWVDRTCGDVLTTRATRIAEIEKSSEHGALSGVRRPEEPSPLSGARSPSSEALTATDVQSATRAPSPYAPDPAESTALDASTAAGVGARPRVGRLAAALGLVAFGLLVAGVFAAPPRALVAQPPQVPAAGAPSTPLATASVARSAAETEPAASSPPPVGPPVPSSSAAPLATAPRPAAPRPPKRRGCDPPFAIVDGIKTYKPACL
jgi:eukaryotic-like serine/threonine-protein kinase